MNFSQKNFLIWWHMRPFQSSLTHGITSIQIFFGETGNHANNKSIISGQIPENSSTRWQHSINHPCLEYHLTYLIIKRHIILLKMIIQKSTLIASKVTELAKQTRRIINLAWNSHVHSSLHRYNKWYRNSSGVKIKKINNHMVEHFYIPVMKRLILQERK